MNKKDHGNTGNKHRATHGMCGTPAYNSWANMIQRCLNPNNPDYRHYGARGITIWQPWLNFNNFIADMGEPKYSQTIDRINNDRGYSPGNCRWASRKQQNRNTRTARMITFCGITRSMRDWEESLGMKYDKIRGRLRNGWTIEKALSTP